MRADRTEKEALLVPDLPGADELMPWLRRIDAARQYSNRGPLVTRFEAELAGHLARAGLAATAPALVAVASGTACTACDLD